MRVNVSSSTLCSGCAGSGVVVALLVSVRWRERGGCHGRGKGAERSSVLEKARQTEVEMFERSRGVHDSEAISASRKRPGMIYVKERMALSICPIDDAFCTMNSSYLCVNSAGKVRMFEASLEVLWSACIFARGLLGSLS